MSEPPKKRSCFLGGFFNSDETTGKDLILRRRHGSCNYITRLSYRVTLGLALPLSPAITIAHEDLVSRDDI